MTSFKHTIKTPAHKIAFIKKSLDDFVKTMEMDINAGQRKYWADKREKREDRRERMDDRLKRKENN